MNCIDELNRKASIVGGKVWGAEKGKPRIYMNYRKDVKVFFEFPDFDTVALGGACLKIFIDDCGQHPNWYVSQRKQIMASFMKEGLAIMALDSVENRMTEAEKAAMPVETREKFAREIMEMDEDFSETQINTASHEFINGRVEAGMAILEAK